MADVGDKLHVKHVSRIDMDAVAALECMTAKTAEDFAYAREWVRNDARYATVPPRGARGAPETRMSDAWVQQLLEFGVTVRIPRRVVRGWVRMFAVPEPAKRRWRPIKHTADANTALTEVMPTIFPTKQERCDLVHAGDYFIALDFAAYYDQFTYSAEVGSRFCFRRGNHYYRLNTLAMGQRQAVEVAATTTAKLLDFGPRSTTSAIIDNVIFVGSREDVLRDAAIFVERVKAVNGQLNEDTSDLEALVMQEGDWGGVRINTAHKTARLTTKTVDKVECSWRFRGEWTWRNFAAHVGLLFWAWQIIELPMPEFFNVLRFISKAGQILERSPELWDTPADVWPCVWPELERWTLLVMRNEPRRVTPASTPDWVVATDASSWGWGYVAVNGATGAVRSHGAPWSDDFARDWGHKLWSSVFTEPRAILNAMCHLLDPTRPTSVKVLTDNTASRASFERGYSAKSFHINDCIRMLRKTFGDTVTFDFGYIPGEENPADPWSRGVHHNGVSG